MYRKHSFKRPAEALRILLISAKLQRICVELVIYSKVVTLRVSCVQTPSIKVIMSFVCSPSSVLYKQPAYLSKCLVFLPHSEALLFFF